MLQVSIWGLLNTRNRTDLLTRARALAAEAAALYDRGRRECEANYLEAYRIFQKYEEKEDMARTALGLGRVYMHIHGLRDLRKSKNWYEAALAHSVNRLTRAEAFGSLALWEQQQFELENTDRDGAVPAGLRRRLDKAEELFCKALELMPETSVVSRAVTLRGLASVLARKGDIDGAERYLREVGCVC
jgi:tetratricopeptide (TPR) repeat protein